MGPADGMAGSDQPLSLSELPLTLEKKVVLHLFRLGHLREEFEVPLALSQEGISERFEVRQSSISRVLNKMLRQQLVEERQAYVSGSRQKRKVYFLTHHGHQVATDLRNQVEGCAIRVSGVASGEAAPHIEHPQLRALGADPDGPRPVARLMRVAELRTFLGKDPDLVDVITINADMGIVDIDLLREGRRKGGERIVVGDPLPTTRQFVGRALELRAVTEGLATPKGGTVVIQGIAGVGKTSLLAKVVRHHSAHVAYQRIRPWTGVSAVLATFSELLHRAGRNNLSNQLKVVPTPPLEVLLPLATNELGHARALVVLDDVEEASPPVQQFVAELVRLAPQSGLHILVATRYVTNLYDRRAVVTERTVREVHLRGLSLQETYELLEGRLPTHRVEALFDKTQGHPLAIDLLRARDSFVEVEKFLQEEIISRLSPPERRMMQLATILRNPVSEEFLAGQGGIETVRSLAHKGLLTEIEGEYEPHLLVRQYVHSHLTEAERRAMHTLALEAYAGRRDEDSLLERCYHMFSSGERASAVAMLLAESDPLLHHGYGEAVTNLVSLMLPEVDAQDFAALHQLQAKIADTWGRWEMLFEVWDHFYFLRQRAGLSVPTFPGREFLGPSAEPLEHTVRDLTQTLSTLQRLGDRHGIAHTHGHLGWTLAVHGQLAEAASAYHKALEGARDLGLEELAGEFATALALVVTLAMVPSGPSAKEPTEGPRLLVLEGATTPEGDAAALGREGLEAIFDEAEQHLRRVDRLDGLLQAKLLREEGQGDGPFSYAAPLSARLVEEVGAMARRNLLVRAEGFIRLHQARRLATTSPTDAAELAAQAKRSFETVNDRMGTAMALSLLGAIDAAPLSRRGAWLEEAAECFLEMHSPTMGRFCDTIRTNLIPR